MKGVTRKDSNMNDFDKPLSELEYRTAKIKLEEQNTKRFLKTRPRKLPYLDAREWVQYNLGVSSKEEFDDLVANGNLRTPYIPKNPESFYTTTGDWISWEHFLLIDARSKTHVPPATGKFD